MTRTPLDSALDAIIEPLIESKIQELEESLENKIANQLRSMTEHDVKEITSGLEDAIDIAVAKSVKKHLSALAGLIIDKFSLLEEGG